MKELTLMATFLTKTKLRKFPLKFKKVLVGATENSPIHFGHLDISDRTYTIGFLESLTIIPFCPFDGCKLAALGLILFG